MSDALPNHPPGPSPEPEDFGEALAPGTRLGEFEIREVLGAGGFGIVYRAWDTALEREVAVKEFMPVTLAGRGPGARVTLRSRSAEENFALGLRSFVNEARLLARFDHPALVKVHRFWEDNATAYMAMPFYRGRTLRQLRAEMRAGPFDEAWARSLIDPLLGALEVLHRAEVFHRDIAPDNILWCDDGGPVLLDFGAARQVLADRTQNLTAILKPQFAPIEQYADTQVMRQGPWTDLYGLASTCYYMLAGKAPIPATARVLSDDLTPLARLAPPGCSARLLESLDWAMAVRPQDRPQSVQALRDVLDGRAPLPIRDSAVPTRPTTNESPPEAPRASPTAPPARKRWPLGALVAGLLACAGAATAWFGLLPHATPKQQGASAPAPVFATPEATKPAASAVMAVASAASTSVSASALAEPAASVAPRVSAAAPASTAPKQLAAAMHPSLPSHPHTTVQRPDAASQPSLEPTRDHSVTETITRSEVPAPAAQVASAAAHRRSLREICTDEHALNVNNCVRRLCETDSRFANYPACIHLREKELLQRPSN
ncbi:MAG: serine/threonine protein kinase [Paucibacter sp.]|nr:serine/threonine protein kinase [Roseateles sp.]